MAPLVYAYIERGRNVLTRGR